MNNYLKFGLLIAAILGTLAWLAVGGINETKTYYKTIAEVNQMGDQAKDKRIRVGGDVAANSIVREGTDVKFTARRRTSCGCRWCIAASIRCRIRLRTARRRWPTANSVRTACSTPPRSRPSALRNMKRSRSMANRSAARTPLTAALMKLHGKHRLARDSARVLFRDLRGCRVARREVGQAAVPDPERGTRRVLHLGAAHDRGGHPDLFADHGDYRHGLRVGAQQPRDADHL